MHALRWLLMGSVVYIFFVQSSAVWPAVLYACLWLRPLLTIVMDWVLLWARLHSSRMSDEACGAAAAHNALAALKTATASSPATASRIAPAAIASKTATASKAYSLSASPVLLMLVMRVTVMSTGR